MTRNLILFNKPFGVLSQFTPEDGHPGLSDYLDLPDVYAAGRLDVDSEGLLLLTDDGALQQAITRPGSRRKGKRWKTYLVQVERTPDAQALASLRTGVEIRGRRTRPAKARLIAQPAWLWPRNPPIRQRDTVPTAWLELALNEGRNRQVRRMTAAVGHPTLRLIRSAIGTLELTGLAPGEWRYASPAEIEALSVRG